MDYVIRLWLGHKILHKLKKKTFFVYNTFTVVGYERKTNRREYTKYRDE